MKIRQSGFPGVMQKLAGKGLLLLSVTVMASALTGCFDSGKQQFEAARDAALKAKDPYLALETFRAQSGDYQTSCSVTISSIFSHSCDERGETEKNIVLAALDKGSVPALVFLFDPYGKVPSVYPNDLARPKAEQLAGRLLDLAEKAPADQAHQALLLNAARVSQRGAYVSQNSAKAAAYYIRAWQAGERTAAAELADLYRYTKDYRRAYFWAIRSRGLNNDDRAQLTGQDITEIQRLAADNTRVNL